ncbi:hypothetical protein BN946_scf184493.g10 [Trametes cinnabarina]|uniref:Uncharacterized protein n=1 Tax=Pycnoporus cinnabarinus TaxID=5643 RepID=A0A060SMG7_PYCCI|nr:hypothetical protein BN946_scf184493.g10 [Trametes cinnabarina]
MHHRAHPSLGLSTSSPSTAAQTPARSMNVFNPKILDASIRDVTAGLSDEQKADVLLYAMNHLKPERFVSAVSFSQSERLSDFYGGVCRGSSKTLIENAVQSCLAISRLPPADAARARLVRAKARLAAGLRVGAREGGSRRLQADPRPVLTEHLTTADIQAVLELQPDNAEAAALMAEHVVSPDQVGRYSCCFLPLSSLMPFSKQIFKPRTTPGFSTEIWREIALWLPPRDLKSLLQVPHVLSRIASELLFQRIDLHLASEKRESQRSADILTRMITDASFASHVKTLRVYVPGRETFPITFQTGMLSNALPKLTNLKNVHCAMRWKDMYSIMRVLESISHRLTGLSLMPSDGTGELRFPRFKHIMQFSYHSAGGSMTQVNEFLLQNKTSIRHLSLHNPNWSFPTDIISIRHLTTLDFQGTFPVDSRAFAEILSNGHQLESLRLECILECTASKQFREAANALPFLRHFAFSLMGYRVNDHDLFPAIAEFLKGRTSLRTLELTVPSADWALKRLGYDATVWGVLPSLTSLQSLTATLPKDVAAAVAMWLVPRGVRALSLHALTPVNTMEFVSQLRAGLPPQLKYIRLSHFHIDDPAAVIEQGFPMVHVARFDDDYYTVERVKGQIQLEEWPKGRTQYNARDWLECYDCEEAEWRDPTQFL